MMNTGMFTGSARFLEDFVTFTDALEDLVLAPLIVVAINMHNFPEAVLAAPPLREATGPRLVEPVGALAGFIQLIFSWWATTLGVTFVVVAEALFKRAIRPPRQ